MLSSGFSSKIFPLLEFALGIESAQAIVVLSVLILALIMQNFFQVSKRDWVLVVSALVIGIILPILRDNFNAI